MTELTCKAPAKINLSLCIKKKRSDGFHELETLMVPLFGLHDTLLFTASEAWSLTCDVKGVPVDGTNLVMRAVRDFEQKSKISSSYAITLTKQIPHGAGLGGGSSDAASTLLALNELSDYPLSFLELHQLAAELGSDVPFFLYRSPCYCRGRGEIIEPLDKKVQFPVLLLKPAFSVSTPDAFKRWGESSEVQGFPYFSQEGPFGVMSNDLERPVFEKFLFLGELKKWLLAQPEVKVAQMSGSGSTMIAILKEIECADALASRAKEEWDPHLFTWVGNT